MGFQSLGRAQRVGATARHAVGDGEEMQVVAVVHDGVQALDPAGPDVRLIGPRRLLVAPGGGGIVPRALVDVRGHVHEMSGGRRQHAQPGRVRERPLRIR